MEVRVDVLKLLKHQRLMAIVEKNGMHIAAYCCNVPLLWVSNLQLWTAMEWTADCNMDNLARGDAFFT